MKSMVSSEDPFTVAVFPVAALKRLLCLEFCMAISLLIRIWPGRKCLNLGKVHARYVCGTKKPDTLCLEGIQVVSC